MIYPWQTTQWQQLLASKQQNRLPHAILLTGVSGLGKKEFAFAFAEVMLCEHSDTNGQPCHTCHACHLFKASTHPDFLYIAPEQPGQAIKVDQIRELIQDASETALQGGFRIIIIHPANAMNINASNALLKTLEEPAPNTLFILISDHGARLPATISSRCQKIYFKKPTQEEAYQFLKTEIKETEIDFSVLLKLADGAPLKAKEIIEKNLIKIRHDLLEDLHKLSQKKADPLQVAARWYETDMSIFFHGLLSVMRDIFCFKLTKGEAELIHSDRVAFFKEINPKISKEKMLQFQQAVEESYKNTLRPVNLNRQLLLEELFIRWNHYVSG